MKRILAIIIAVFLTLSTFVPFVFADYSSQPVTFWDKYLYQWSHQGDGLGLSLGPLSIPLDRIGTLACHLSSQLCASSDDHLHHADSIQQGTYRTDSDGHGCVVCTCKFCGQDFVYRSDDLQQDYNIYVHDNNLDNGLNVAPDGGFLWYPDTLSLFSFVFRDSSNGSGDSCDYYGSAKVGTFSTFSALSSRSFSYSFYNCSRWPVYDTFSYRFAFKPPLNGTYTVDNSCSYSVPFLPPFSFSPSPISGRAGVRFDMSVTFPYGPSVPEPFSASVILPFFHVVPNTSISAPSVPSTININNNNYNVTDFNFYLRQYHTTNENNENITITYGDENITIYNETTGVTIINNYYIETDPGNDNPDPGSSSDPGGSSTVDPGDASGSGGSGCCEQCALLLRQVNSYLLQIQTLVDQINDKLGPESDNYMEGIYNLLVEINTALDNLPTEPHKDYEAKLTTISNQLANIWGDLDTIKTSLSAVQTNTATTNQKLDTVHADLQAVLSELQTQRGILSQILSVLRDMLGHITSIDSNVEELANEEDSQSFFDSFILKFHFIGDIFSIIRQLFADITNDAATVTFVDNGDLPIGDLTSQHFPVSGSPVPVGTAPQVLIKFPSDTYHGADLSGYSAIDMSWYAPYKSRVDALISGFLWIGYLWLLFKRAPGIVRGAAMIEETNYKIEDWKNGG